MLYLSACLLFTVAHAQVPVVKTTEGKVEGINAKDGDYFIYYGIPYAGAPTRSYRFKAPIPPRHHADIFYAKDNSTTCAHWEEGLGMTGKEDCLVLNIHTKNVESRSPVMVILFGERFVRSSANKYSMKQFVDKNIVVVTVNYRLSIFGFLCLGVPEAPGNAGLKDVLQSLRWLHYNINEFGGDRNNVMLFGHGSGAVLVDLITLTPLSASFVHKAVTQSGSALAPWAIAYTPVACARSFAERMNAGELAIAEMDQHELAIYLLKSDMRSLSSGYGGSPAPDGSVLFPPCVENKDLNGTVITEAPIDILRSGTYNHIPYIAGFTDKEGTVRMSEAVNGGWFQQMQRNFSNFISVDLSFQSSHMKNAQAYIIRTFYFGQRPLNMESISEYLHYFGDTMFVMPGVRGARERALTSRAEVRVYEFSYVSNKDVFLGLHVNGTEHGAILNYLFDYNLSPDSSVVREKLLNHYVLFAYEGRPSNAGMGFWEHISKERISMDENIPYLRITGEDNMAPGKSNFDEIPALDPHGDEWRFWDEIYKQHYVPPEPVSSSNKLLSYAIVPALARLAIRLL